MEIQNKKNNKEGILLEIGDNSDSCQNQDSPYLVLDAFAHCGLDEHNRSLLWIEETAVRIGAWIDTTTTGGWSRGVDYFEIKFPGRSSGVLYRIIVGHSKRHAELLSRRIGEFEVDEVNAIAILHAFDQLMTFDVEWYDLRKGEWNSICMRDVKGEYRAHWPGDAIVSVMLSLSDDLRSCLEKSMQTLRREMREALVTYWFAGRTPEGTSFQQVAAFVSGLRELQDAPNVEEYHEVADRMAQSEILSDGLDDLEDGGR